VDPDEVISLVPDLPELAQLQQQLSQPRWADSACTFVRQVSYVDRISTTVEDSSGGDLTRCLSRLLSLRPRAAKSTRASDRCGSRGVSRQ